ncbi:MAG: pyruvate dehydrogenase (acetyl-transferring), homodimeric type, partial [Pseudomonadota bacterium]
MTDLSYTRFLASADGAGVGAPADADPAETAEWRDAFLAVVAAHGPARARFLLDEMARLAHTPAIGWQPELVTPYINTIAVD